MLRHQRRLARCPNPTFVRPTGELILLLFVLSPAPPPTDPGCVRGPHSGACGLRAARQRKPNGPNAPQSRTGDQRPNAFPFEVFRATRFVRGVRCPRCQRAEVRRWGGFAGRRRYRCRSCGRTFSDFTGTPLAYLKRIDRWSGHCASVEETDTVREEAARLGVHRNTAFRWRHRLLDALHRRDATVLDGVVILRDTPFAHSEKGSRHVAAPRRRGWGTRGEWLRARQAWVMTAHSQTGRVVSGVAGPLRPSAKDYQHLLAGRLSVGVRLASDRGLRGPAVTSYLGSVHKYEPAHHFRKDREDAGRYIARLRGWIRRFHGVATKYLPHYLLWHRYHEALTIDGVDLGRWRLTQFFDR
jgi:transposase-like protein